MSIIRARSNRVVFTSAIVATLAAGITAAVTQSRASAAPAACSTSTYSYSVVLTNGQHQSVTLHGIQNLTLQHDRHSVRSKLDDGEFSTVTSDFGDRLPTDTVTFTKLFETSALGLKHEAFLTGLAHHSLASVSVSILNGTTVVDHYDMAPAYVESVTHSTALAGSNALPSEVMSIIGPTLDRPATATIDAGPPKVSSTGWAYKTKINYTNSSDQPATHLLVPSKVTIDQNSADAEGTTDSSQLTEFSDAAGTSPAATFSLTVPYVKGDNSFNEFSFGMDEAQTAQTLTSAKLSILDDNATDINYTSAVPRFPSISLLFPKLHSCASLARPVWVMKGIVKNVN